MNTTQTRRMAVLCMASIIIQFANSRAAANTPVTWDVQQGGNGHTYVIRPVANPGDSWDESRLAAQAEGGYLATITSQAEQDFLVNTVLPTDTAVYSVFYQPWGYWLGGQRGTAGWSWVTGEAF